MVRVDDSEGLPYWDGSEDLFWSISSRVRGGDIMEKMKLREMAPRIARPQT